MKISCAVLGLFFCATALAQFVAFNDHAAGPNTHSNATRWNAFGTRDGAPGTTGRLRDIHTGEELPVTLQIVATAPVQAGLVQSPPAAGTPAHNVFGPYVDFEGMPNPSLEMTNSAGFVTCLFSGLDPARRYVFRASAARGDPAYTNRWTVVELINARSFTNAHSAGVLTANEVASLATNQAAVNFGVNHTPDTGDYVGWNLIVPSTNGTFSVRARRYSGTVPAGSAGGPVSYGFTAVQLIEIDDATEVDLLALDAEWKYDGAGIDRGAAWRSPDYDDSAWPAEPGVFGFPVDEPLPPGAVVRTVLPRFVAGSSTTQVITHYFRTHFTLRHEPSEVTVIASNLVDDGAVFYVNGEEAFRVGLPSGQVDHSTLANRSDDIGGFRWDVFEVPREHLKHGDNVVAVELHQGSLTSSDAVFGSTLTALVIPATPLQITNQPADLVAFEGDTVHFTAGVSGTRARYQWMKDGAAINGATSPTLVLTNLTLASAGGYSVTAMNSLMVVTSRVAQLEVRLDITPPRLISADEIETGMVLLAFSEPVLEVTATNIASYSVSNTAGGSTVIIGAVLANGTNVLLFTEERAPGMNHIVTANGVSDLSPRQNAGTTAAPIATMVTLVPLDATWAFFDPFPPIDDPDPGAAWNTLEFPDASSWGSGQALFFFGFSGDPPDTRTHLTQTPALTSFFRAGFNLNASRGGLRLFVQHIVNDGAVFHVNGREALRVNLPPGEIGIATPALANRGASEPVGFDEIQPDGFQPGSNVFAAELHQWNSNDPRKVFAAKLTARVESYLTGALVLFSGPDDQTVAEAARASFSVVQAGAATFQWQRDGVDIAGETNPVYTIPATPALSDGLQVRVVLRSPGHSITSSPAMLHVLPDTNPPVLLSAMASNRSVIVVSFSKPVSAATATNISNYTVLDAAGQVVPVEHAGIAGGTNVVLTLSGLLAGHYTVTVDNVTDASARGNPVAPRSTVTVGAEYFLPLDSAWKYLLTGTDEALHATFAGVDYDDSSWAGPADALLYVEDASLPGPKNTPLSLFADEAMTQRINTYYFRKVFLAPVASSNLTLRLRHVIDDGLVLYLNGADIYRFNMPAGALRAALQASTSIGDATLLGPFDVVVTNLAAGTNIFAAAVHQSGTASQDIVFGLEATASIASEPGVIAPLPPRLAFIRETGQLAIAWEGGGTIECAPTVAGPWESIGIVSPYFVSPTNAAAFYRVRR